MLQGRPSNLILYPTWRTGKKQRKLRGDGFVCHSIIHVKMNIDTRLSSFEKYLFSINYSELTIPQYLRVATQYLLLADEEKDPWGADSIRAFMADQRSRGSSGNTLRNKYYTLKTFFTSQGKHFPLSKRDVPKAAQKERVKLSSEERRAMSIVAENHMGLRNSAILHLDEALGIRRIEFRYIKVGDYKRPYVEVRTRKRGFAVMRLLSERACNVLDRWILEREDQGAGAGDPLFNARDSHDPLSLRQLSSIYKEAAKLAGVKEERIGFHAHRRGIVTETLCAGVLANEVTAEFGWRDKSTVLDYGVIEKEEAEQSIIERNPVFRQQGHVITTSKPSALERRMNLVSENPRARASETPHERRMRLIGLK